VAPDAPRLAHRLRTAHPIPYEDEMLRLVEHMNAAAESPAAFRQWVEDHMGGRVLAFRQRLMPQILAFTDLRDLEILDFGCGTGSTTVVLAESTEDGRITATDIDRQALEIAALRFRHHGVEHRIRIQHIPPVVEVGDLPFQDERFDFILANGVLEHVVPFSARPKVVLEMWRILKQGGLLCISETPNVLWPMDRHTTGLPILPWLPPRVAYRLAVACGRHRPGTNFDVRGWRGMSYWGIVRPLRRAGRSFEVLNVTVARNRLLPAGLGPGEVASAKRRLGTFLLEQVAGRGLAVLGIPPLAFGPFIEYLCLRKTGA
jgi:2-polyprenyl-3-methyl-5-hydroxy-6-metoxy-1,4-benzoquinol methylase